jgi:hypothetical protein
VVGVREGVRTTILLAAGALLLSACGDESNVVADTTVEHPYDGPMYVERGPDNPDAAKRSGAAGMALECDGAVYNGGAGDYADSGLESVQDDARAAFANWTHEEGLGASLPGPDDGYVVERVEGDRVLLSYDVDGRTKVAVIAADGIRDWNDDEGWGVESWGQCDPAELPAEVTDELGIAVWQDAEGRRVPIGTLSSADGPEHCDWQDNVFLHLGDGTYLRDTKGELRDFLKTTYSDTVELPTGARDTGYQHDGRRLWLAADGSAAYLVATSDPADVERWPAAGEPIGCA